MIKFKSITAKNILSVGNIPITITYDANPTTIVIGKNGHGKSVVLLEALFYALYGKSFRGLTLPMMINSINKKDMLVELTFESEGKSYKVIRGSKPNIFEVYVNGELREPPANLKEYQKWFSNSVLKMDDKTFSQIVILGSTSYKPFLTLGAADRRIVIEELLDIQVFSDMNMCAKQQVSALKSKLSMLETDLNRAAALKTAKEKHLADLQSSNQNIEKEYQSKLNELEQELQDTLPKGTAIQEEIEQLLKTVEDKTKINENVQKGRDIINQHKATLRDSQSVLSFYSKNDVCPTCDSEISLELKSSKIESSNKASEHANKIIEVGTLQLGKLTDKINKIQAIQDEVHNKERSLSATQARISQLQKQIKSGQDALSKLSTTGPDLEPVIQEIAGFDNSIKTHDADIKECNKQEVYNTCVLSILKDTGVKSKIIKTYIPIINKLLEKYLAIMDFNVSIMFDENFKETIKLNFRDEYGFSNLSDGQKCRINLAVLFAFREVARLKNSSATSILILDEVGASTLDADGMDSFMKIVRETSKASNVFIITHDDVLKDSFSDHLEFELVNKVTRLK